MINRHKPLEQQAQPPEEMRNVISNQDEFQNENALTPEKMRIFLANLYDPEFPGVQAGALLSDYEAWKLMKALRKMNVITLEIYKLGKKIAREDFEKTLLYE